MNLFAERAPWFVAGPLIGLCVVLMLALANRPFGAAGGFIDLVAWIRQPLRAPKWTLALLAGAIAGGFLSGLASGHMAMDPGYALLDQRFGIGPAMRYVVLVGAGLVMGFGIRTACGCTSGHGICGAALGSRASWVATATFMGTAMLSAQVIAWIWGRG